MGKAHSNRGYRLRFKDRAAMNRFILMYRDLFVPYSEDKIRCRSYVRDTPNYRTKNGNLRSKGHHDENIINMLRCGYDMCTFGDETLLTVNMYPEDFNSIPKDGFVKTKFRSNYTIWEFVG